MVKVGDKVRVLKSGVADTSEGYGAILTVTNVNNSMSFTTTTSDFDGEWFFGVDRITLGELELLPQETSAPNVLTVKFKKLSENAVVPKYAKPGDAGLDLTAVSYEYDGLTKRHVYGTALAAEVPEGHVGLIFPRSSICKKDLRLTNSVGVIDSGYRGEIKFFFDSTGFDDDQIYNVGDRIGQLIIMPYPKIDIQVVDELSSTERGDGGFGSSGR